MVSNGVIRTTSGGQDRMRVHLETIADLNEAGNKVLFSISPYSTYLVISPKEIVDGVHYTKHDGHASHKWLTVNGGNDNALTGVSSKTGGPEGYVDTKDIVGIFTQNDANAKFYLEDASVAAPTFSMDGDGNVTITIPDGTTVHYTTDNTDPTESSTPYTSGTVISTASLNADKTVKAIAVRTSDGVSSAVAVLPLVTYHIVNVAKEVAVSSNTYRLLAGTSVRNGKTDANNDGITDGYNDIPTEIQSQYISDEEITFYTMEGIFNKNNLDDEHKITEIPAKICDIYVTYKLDKLKDKNLHLQGARPFNLKNGSGQYFVNRSGTTTIQPRKQLQIFRIRTKIIYGI